MTLDPIWHRGLPGIIIIIIIIMIMMIIIIIFNIHRCIYLKFSKSTQSTAGLKALKPTASVRYLMCKLFPYCLHLLYRTTF